MALRDAIRSPAGAQAFACSLFDFLHGGEPPEIRFASWIAALDALPPNACAHLAARHRLRLYRSAKTAFLFQAQRDARSFAALWDAI
jgi:hypothetical protein